MIADEDDLREAQRRYAIIEPLLKLHKGRGATALARTLAGKHEVSAATIFRWLADYRQSGTLGSLLPRRKGRKMPSRLTKQQERAITDARVKVDAEIGKNALGTQIIDAVNALCRKRGIKAPSNGAIRQRLLRQPVPELAASPPPPADRPSAISLGNTDHGLNVIIDIQTLLAQRLLIVAGSGAGKSWTMRRMFERSFGLVQHIIIDIDGDYRSLADHHDYLVLDEEVLRQRSIDQLAQDIRRHRMSVIVDLSDQDRATQHLWTALFAEGLLAAGRDCWHPVLVGIDEAHVLAPWGGDVTDFKKRCCQAIASLSALGRKRGICTIPATQRLSKLAKNVASEAANVLVGRTVLDIDVSRAADLIGWDKRRAESLRTLQPGEFIGVGPAFGPDAVRFRIGPVDSRHMGAQPELALPPAWTAAEAMSQLLTDVASD